MIGPRGDIEAYVAKPMTGGPTVILLRFYDRKGVANGAVVREFLALGDQSLELWGVNYPGYGGSSGPATLDNIARAVVESYDTVAARAQGRPIVVLGTSIGAAAALHLATVRPVAGLIIQDVPPFRALLLLRYGWWNFWLSTIFELQIPCSLQARDSATRSHEPALFVVSMEDAVSPPDYQWKVINDYAGPLDVLEVPGASHASMMPPAVYRQIHGWMMRLTRAASSR